MDGKRQEGGGAPAGAPDGALSGAAARAWLDRFVEVVERRHEELTELDRRAGDGDFGTSLRSALRRTAANLAADEAADGTADQAAADGSAAGPGATPGAAFAAASRAFLHTGGTSGPLFGMWFRAFATAGGGSWATADLAAAAGNGLAAVRRLGGAEVGDKTMVDAMAPAVRALEEAAARNVAPAEALAAAAAAAHAGAAATERLLARRGRASYVGEHARGVVDPGALTVAWFFDAAAPGAPATPERPEPGR